ncbi:hypothetical protein BANRA_04296 [Acinetobacter baumannii]|nr:hypothetical protein BANRA_04125 [Acinetobacter baumannii]VCX83527.1 hypothetical protein BANRA_04149 [Acinetobacter baumannii]VCX95294.1 hypothetical protein BANRA_04296 [Acinetobacter baumannii]VCZ75651.1 hypothetical protein BANRA_04223 [Acinetobacter baumannii]
MNNDTSKVNRLGKNTIRYNYICFNFNFAVTESSCFRNSDNEIFQNYHYYS